jgi:hypothetical protein
VKGIKGVIFLLLLLFAGLGLELRDLHLQSRHLTA